jgi:predicted Zn-dependent protease
LLYNIGKLDEALAEIIALIKKEPENAKYWIFMHIFTKDTKEDMSKKALFRAYDIDPTNFLVLNSLIAFYFKNKEYIKFFKAIQVA